MQLKHQKQLLPAMHLTQLKTLSPTSSFQPSLCPPLSLTLQPQFPSVESSTMEKHPHIRKSKVFSKEGQPLTPLSFSLASEVCL